MPQPSDPRTTTLYHYTTPAGLIGIISTDAIWATDVAFLNDATEISYAGNHVSDLLRARAEELWPSSAPDEFGEEANRAFQLRTMADQFGLVAIEAIRSPTYVTCFCEHGDLLSQWRGYGVGGGYAIGFRSNLLASAMTTDPDRPVTLRKVEYGLSASEYKFRAIVDRLAPHGVGHPGARSYLTVQLELLPEVARIKDPGFSEELEWRIIVSAEAAASKTVRYRPAPIGIVPYIELPLPSGCITEIIVGPGKNQAARVIAARGLVNRSGLTIPNISITASAIPFRS